MRASRLISVLLLLQTRGHMTARELADELEVSIRTIYRDVEELSVSGIPVYADRGVQGGFQLVEGYRTRLTGFTPQEAETLFLSGYPGPAAQLGLGTVLAAAQLKVLAALPPELRGRAARVRQRFHLDAQGWFREAELSGHLQAIAEAVWSDRRLDIVYRRGDDAVVRRTVDPLGVVLKGGIWYFVGAAATESGSDYRTYRVSRIQEVRLGDERFTRPEDFDLATYWTDSVARYQDSLPTFEATIRLKPSAIERLELAIGETVAKAAIREAGEPDGSGWLTLHLRLEDMWRAEPQMLMLGAEAEILDPPELRERVAAAARGMADRYGAA